MLAPPPTTRGEAVKLVANTYVCMRTHVSECKYTDGGRKRTALAVGKLVSPGRAGRIRKAASVSIITAEEVFVAAWVKWGARFWVSKKKTAEN